MRKIPMSMGLCVMMALAMTVAAEQKAPKAPQTEQKTLPETMKALPAPLQGLRKGLDAKNAADASKDAQTLADLFKSTDAVWAKAKFADAAKMSKDAQAAANQIVAALKTGKFEDTVTSYATLTKSCAGCHAVHREKLPDGTYRMK